MSAFEIVRSAHIAADPARVHALINNFHEWLAWSPWEGLDPALARDFSGPDEGVGAHYAWSGNRKAGSGTMEIVSSNQAEVGIRLSFLKPFKATNHVTFALAPAQGGTDIDWRMNGEQKGMAGIFSKLFNIDKAVGGDFEKGLAQLKLLAES
jgi:Polyketide cyclase / dehydrase and lipid transport